MVDRIWISQKFQKKLGQNEYFYNQFLSIKILQYNVVTLKLFSKNPELKCTLFCFLVYCLLETFQSTN